MAIDVIDGAIRVTRPEPVETYNNAKVLDAFPLVRESWNTSVAIENWLGELLFHLNHSFRHFDIHQLSANFLIELRGDATNACEEAWNQHMMRYKMCDIKEVNESEYVTTTFTGGITTIRRRGKRTEFKVDNAN